MIKKKYPKFKYNCIAPEEVDTDKYYTFSFNPEEQPLFEKFYKTRLNNLHDWGVRMNEIMKSLKYAQVDLVLECSRRGRLHYHGLIKIKKDYVIDFYLKDLKNIAHYGTYEIDHIQDDEKWTKYMMKQEKYMRQFCERNEMIYEIYTLPE